MFYLVTDYEDKDRQSGIIDVFTSRAVAEKFAAEWSAEYGTCEIQESDNIGKVADMNDLFNEIDARFHGRTANMAAVGNEELAQAITDGNETFDALKARFQNGGMEAIYVYA